VGIGSQPYAVRSEVSSGGISVFRDIFNFVGRFFGGSFGESGQ
jgi:hypothetical protein